MINVVVRVRPPLPRELSTDDGGQVGGFASCIELGGDGATIRLRQPASRAAGSAGGGLKPGGGEGAAPYYEYTFDAVRSAIVDGNPLSALSSLRHALL